ncbi:restriction endonuclease subunit S [Chitinibacter tainanensis]|uniref:restriction endonuclease subunit S n=1 Tax=Chitinibacter tainanensis TaxID=230667 RepID=UPI0023527156|nr:restriction endonuclease subunit S [Chitinibacter tainanensis]
MELSKAIPQGYKQTEVGLIPEDWSTQKLGDLVSITSGESPSKFDFHTSGLPYFKVEQLNNGEKYAELTDYFIQSNKAVPAGSIIFPKRGASILSNKIRLLKNPSFMDTNLMALTTHEVLDSEFLFYYLNFYGLDSVADTTSIPQINNKHIIPYVICTPSLQEQKAITKALSDVDTLLAQLDALIAKKRDLKQAAMQQLLTAQTRLPGFSGEWELRPLGSICTLINGRAYGIHEWKNSGTPVIRLQNLTGGENYYHSDLQLPSRQYCEYGDLLFMWSATFGPHIWLGEKAIFHYHIWKIETDPSSTDKYFIYHKLEEITQELKQNSTNGGTMLHLTKGFMEQLKVLVPPTQEEQTAIAETLSDMDTEITALEARRDKTRALKQGMMQELLTGKTRLI